MCLGTHRPTTNLGHKAIEQSLMNATVLKQEPQSQQQNEPQPQREDVKMSPVMPDEDAQQQQQQQPQHPRAPKKQQHHAHIQVQHHYHDHSHDDLSGSIQDNDHEHPARGGVTTPFPLKLHAMLESVEREHLGDVVSWQPHGRCFVVRKPKEFVELLPHYFKLSKLASFQRQLNLYGFQRLTRGRDRGGYYHELFLRNKVFLANGIHRSKVKGTGVRARANPEQEPNFWKMEWMEDVESGNGGGANSAILTPPLEDERVAKSATCAATAPVQSSFVYPGSLPSSSYVPIVSPTTAPRLKVTTEAHDKDVVCAFDRTFHYLDPFQPLSFGEIKPAAVPSSIEVEVEKFFADFDFPEMDQIGAEIEDDAVFGEILASLIA